MAQLWVCRSQNQIVIIVKIVLLAIHCTVNTEDTDISNCELGVFFYIHHVAIMDVGIHTIALDVNGVIRFFWHGAIHKNHLEVNPVERYGATGSRGSGIARNVALALNLLQIDDFGNNTRFLRGINPFLLKRTDCINCFLPIVVKALIAGQKFSFGRSKNQSVVWCII